MSEPEEKNPYPGRGVGKLFEDLRQRWYPSNKENQAVFTRLASRFDKLMNRMQTEDSLRDLDYEFYPEVRQFEAWTPIADRGRREFRVQFYLCLSIIQLMEDVYLDLKLEDNFAHPDNQGWMNTFQRWSGSATVNYVWLFNASLYGTRFRSFVEDRFNLTIGEIGVEEEVEEEGVEEEKDNKVDRVFRVFSIFIEQPVRKETNRLPAGFAVAMKAVREAPKKKDAANSGDVKWKLDYIWIQKPLRRMGIARDAAIKLTQKYDLVAGDPWESKEMFPRELTARIAKSQAAQEMIDEATSTKERLNPEATKALRTIIEQQSSNPRDGKKKEEAPAR